MTLIHFSQDEELKNKLPHHIIHGQIQKIQRGGKHITEKGGVVP